ncbi:hypothetical protein [Sphingomonas sp. UYP23]
MAIGRYLAAGAIWWSVATPGAAQQPPVQAKTGPDIVVQGAVDAPSAWRRAESAHVIVTSKGSEAELKRVTNTLERLYALMARLYHRTDAADDTVKLQVTLVDTADFFQAMKLRNLRSEEGPYAATFAGERYYDPREDGPVLAVARTDQVIKLSTALAEDRDVEDASGSIDSEGSMGTGMSVTAKRPPIARKWEAVLYSAFAQHFLLTYMPAAYPRWYLDGVGALYSTFDVRRDGKVDYARDPLDYRQVFYAYGPLRVRPILTGAYLEGEAGKAHWTPYHAWLLTHFFLFSQLKPERSQQFARYMAAIGRGVPLAEAAKVFGDLNRLQHDLDAYQERGTEYARADAVPPPGGDPTINVVSRSSAAVIEARLELGTRLAAGTSDGAWVAQLHDTVAQLPYSAEALLTEAEVECRAGQNDACLDSAERVLAKTPDNIRALAWKGIALTHQALAGPASDRARGLKAARVPIVRALRIDNDTPLPLLAFFNSYAEAGDPVPDQAVLGLVKVTQAVPAAPGPRVALARELLRQGHADLARQVLMPVLYGGYDSPEKTVAQTLLATAGSAQHAAR